MREFSAINKRIASTPGFQRSFVRRFHMNLSKWEKNVVEMAFTMKQDVTMYPQVRSGRRRYHNRSLGVGVDS